MLRDTLLRYCSSKYVDNLIHIREADEELYEGTFRDQVSRAPASLPPDRIARGETRQGRRASRVFRPTHSLFP